MEKNCKGNDSTDGRKLAIIRHDISLLLYAGKDQTQITHLIAQRHRISRGTAAELLKTQLQARERRGRKRKTAQNDTNHSNREVFTPRERERAYHMVRNMCLFDDYFFQTVFKDNKRAAEELLRPILNDPELTVEHISVQETLPGLAAERAVVIDLQVEMGNGDIVAVEIQRAMAGAVPERPRFIHAKEDTAQLRKGQSYNELRDVYVIVMCEGDPYGAGEPMYNVKKTIAETGEEYNDGSFTIYTNGIYSGDNPMGRLMHDMRATDPEDMHNSALRETVDRYKRPVPEGEHEMGQQATAEFDEFIHGVVRRIYRKEFEEMGTKLRQKNDALAEKDRALAEKDRTLAEKDRTLAEKDRTMTAQGEEIARYKDAMEEQGEEITRYRKEIEELKAIIAAQTGAQSEQ